MTSSGAEETPSVEWTWEEMIDEFRALGGTIENVEQRQGSYGWGLFPVDPDKPIDIRIPEGLLLPPKWVKITASGLVIAEESGLSPRFCDFFARYQRNFSWGRDAYRDASSWCEQINALPDSIRDVMQKQFALRTPTSRVDDEFMLQRYLSSRTIIVGGELFLMPIIELLNHSPMAKGFDTNTGVRVSGKFPDEVLVNYGATDPLHRYIDYGFISEEKAAFSIDLQFSYQGKSIWVNRRFDMVQDDSGVAGLLPIVREGKSGDLVISHVMLGTHVTPRIPRSIFRRILPQLSSHQADELFQIIVSMNITILVEVLGVLDDSLMSCDLRKVIHLQLKALANSYGVRELESLPGM